MIEFGMDMRSLLDRLHTMKKRGDNLEPALDEIGDIFVTSIDLNFSLEGRHNGDPDSIFGGDQKWKPWSPGWKARRVAMGKDGKILTLDGGLVSSIDFRTTSDSLIISSGKEYAEKQHKERPFLVIQKEDLEEAIEVLGDYVMGD